MAQPDSGVNLLIGLPLAGVSEARHLVAELRQVLPRNSHGPFWDRIFDRVNALGEVLRQVEEQLKRADADTPTVTEGNA